ncbi:hypothetical protein CRUP_017433, partial [Coryphaenoides rupestris]
CHKLATRVLECQDLPIVNGQCDPYAAVSLLGPTRSEVKKTKVLGPTGFHDAWYFLQPRDGGGRVVEDLGSLRLNIVYTEDHVFSSHCYTALRELLLLSASVQPVSASAAHILGEVCREKQEAAVPLVRLFLHGGQILPFLRAIAHAEICTNYKPCEIDPVRLKESENLETNRENLRLYVERVLSLITASGVRCPSLMCDLFSSLRESAASRFHASSSSAPTTRVMIKRAQGRKRFGMKNFKKRWFRLTNQEFTYHKTKGEGALCSIPIENILAVERLEEESFKMKNMFQVVQPERALYIQANNCVEASDWMDILSKVSQCNRRRLSTFHPSAHLHGHWLCCGLAADAAAGCTPCTGGLPDNIQLDVDGDRETERIYSLFSCYMSKLLKMQEACGSRSVYDGPELEEYSSFVIEEPQETYQTLRLLVAAVQTLEQRHESYRQDQLTKTKIGSQEHPIGDKSFQCDIGQQSESTTYSI